MLCGACNEAIDYGCGSEEAITVSCASCLMKFHLGCLSLSRVDSKAARTGGLNNYRCPSCKVKTKQRFTDSTPVRTGKQRNDHPTDTSDDMASTNKPVEVTSSPIPESVLTSFTQTLLQLQGAFNTMKEEFCAFTISLSSTSDDIELFRKEMSEVKKELKELDRYRAEVTELRAEVSELRQELESRQQREYLKDIEISGITEHQGENLPQLVSNISTKLGLTLSPHDIVDIKRVGQRSNVTEGNARPRPVIISFTRRAPRDHLLRASRVRRGLSTDMIEVPGNVRRVYVNEHLTKPNRILFSKARAIGLELKFKYVWTANGAILMRRTETSSVLRVNSEDILFKLVGQQSTNNGPTNTHCP